MTTIAVESTAEEQPPQNATGATTKDDDDADDSKYTYRILIEFVFRHLDFQLVTYFQYFLSSFS